MGEELFNYKIEALDVIYRGGRGTAKPKELAKLASNFTWEIVHDPVLSSLFPDEIIHLNIPIQVKRRDAGLTKRRLTSFLDTYKDTITEEKGLDEIFKTGTEQAEKTLDVTSRGTSFLFRFHGRSVLVSGTRGVKYISILIRHAGREVPSVLLHAGMEQTQSGFSSDYLEPFLDKKPLAGALVQKKKKTMSCPGICAAAFNQALSVFTIRIFGIKLHLQYLRKDSAYHNTPHPVLL